jgi:hypothetical protein
VSISVDLGDIGDFNRRMQQAPQIIREEMVKGVNNATSAGTRQAHAYAPVKTGFLRGTIIRQPAAFAGGTVTGSYGTNTTYARIVEEGRGPVVAKPGKYLRFEIGGKVFFRKRVGPAKGKFYMKRSRQWLEPQLSAEFRAVAQRIVNRLGG